MEDSFEEQLNSMCDLNKSTGRLTAGTYSCAATHISSRSDSGAKTLIVYENDDSVEIKQEIIEERYQGGEDNLLSEENQLDEKSLSSGNKSAPKTSIVYEYDETLEVKEEIAQGESNSIKDLSLSAGSSFYYCSDVSDTCEYDEDSKIKKEITQDQRTVSGQKVDRKYDSTLNIADTREPDISCAEQLRTNKKKKIQETKTKAEKEYKCRRCARSYTLKGSLYKHKKFHCGVTPQFICKFCDKRFKRKGDVNRHIVRVHQPPISNQKKQKIQESTQKHNCDKCSKSYSSFGNLKKHERLKHTVDKPQFICDICDHIAYTKGILSAHITLRHLPKPKISEEKHNCDKCSLNYFSLGALQHHKRLKHAAVKQEFICDFCGYKTDMKSSLSRHIALRHLKNTKTSEVRHNCEKCSLTYRYSRGLSQHKRLKHATIKT